MVFVFLLFALGSVNIGLNMQFGELVWVDERGFPGGPLAYLTTNQAVASNTAGNAVGIIITAMADALLIWRCYVLYKLWWLTIIPILMWIVSVVFSAFFVFQAAEPNAGLFASNSLNFGITYFAIGLSLNILLTLLLVARLFYVRRTIIATLGSQYGETYGTVATMLLESATPYAIVSFIFLILYSTQNNAAALFVPLLVQVECISPMLIILRVAGGRAWTSDTISESNLTKLRFAASKGSSRRMGQRDTGAVSTNLEFSSRSKGSETAYGSEDQFSRIQFSTATETV